jgi:hypothetical protein
MDDATHQEVEEGESYGLLLKSYYDRLHAKKNDPRNSAMEEVKLRLFLSLLDKPALLEPRLGDEWLTTPR